MPILSSQTLLFRSPSALISQLPHLTPSLPKSKSKADHTLLFALSASTPSSALSSVLDTLRGAFPRHVGCLSAPLTSCNEARHALSLAVLDGTRVTSFRSEIPGRAAPQVGRWHAARRDNRREVGGLGGSDGSLEGVVTGERANWEDVWARTADTGRLPEGLEGRDLSSVLYFSDLAPEGLDNALCAAYPNATKLGLLASSTPFITGRPVTLFHDGAIHGSGAVGLGFVHSESPSTSVHFPGLVELTPALTITQSEGNLVLTLDDANPTRLLLSAIAKHGLATSGAASTAWLEKEDKFFLGVMNGDELSQVYDITSGDPSRGTIALASQAAPKEGSVVKLYHQPQNVRAPSSHNIGANADGQHVLSFVAALDAIVAVDSAKIDGSGADDEDEVTVLPSRFEVASENGFVLGRRGEASWRCLVEGGSVGLRWPRP